MISSAAFAQTTAPRSGTLVIQGGGPSTVARDEFIRLAGGAKANIVVIPTAAGLDNYGEEFQAQLFRGFREQGVTAISLLHTTSRQTADSDAFVAPLANATGVWFIGGRQWRLADAYLGTKTEAALWRLLDRGGVIGGTSAGATILGSYLHARRHARRAPAHRRPRARPSDSSRTAQSTSTFSVRNRQFDLIPIIHAHPELLGIGIDQDAAIVVQGDEFRVLTGYVAIYDPASDSCRRPLLLPRKGRAIPVVEPHADGRRRETALDAAAHAAREAHDGAVACDRRDVSRGGTRHPDRDLGKAGERDSSARATSES